MGSINWFELQHNICFSRELNHVPLVMGFVFVGFLFLFVCLGGVMIWFFLAWALK